MARAARGRRPSLPRPRDVDVPRLRRGGERARALVGAAHRAAAELERPGHPLRHALVAVRRLVRRRPLERAREARAPEDDGELRDRARGGRLHLKRPALLPRGPGRAARNARQRRAARARARLPAPARDPRQVLLEERQVAARHRALEHRPPRLLGALRLPQRRRPLAGGALRLLRRITRRRDRRAARAAETRRNPHPPPPPPKTPFPPALPFF